MFYFQIKREGDQVILLGEGDESSQSPSAWLPLVPAARDRHQQNVEAMLDGTGHIYYQTLRDVCRGEALAVWYGEVLAHHADIPVLRPENIRGRLSYGNTSMFLL